MKTLLQLLSFIALAVTIGPSLLYFSGAIGHESVTWITLMGTVIWFAVTPLWMSRKLPIDAKEVEI